jgi:hypothetical protein
MPHFEVVSYTVQPVDGDTQIEVVIHASDGNKWEYGIPYGPTGRYQFPEVDVLEVDFGGEFVEELVAKIEALVAKLTRR